MKRGKQQPTTLMGSFFMSVSWKPYNNLSRNKNIREFEEHSEFVIKGLGMNLSK